MLSLPALHLVLLLLCFVQSKSWEDLLQQLVHCCQVNSSGLHLEGTSQTATGHGSRRRFPVFDKFIDARDLAAVLNSCICADAARAAEMQFSNLSPKEEPSIRLTGSIDPTYNENRVPG